MSYQALELDGNGYASIADAPEQGLNMGLSDFMIEAWIKADPTQPVGAPMIVSKGDVSTGYRFYLASDTRVLKFMIRDAGGTIFAVIGTTALNDGRWHYVAVVADRSANVTGYVDGSAELLVDISSRSASIDTAADFNIGSEVPSNYFTGLIDEVRVWNFGYGGLPSVTDYITWRAAGRNVFLDISNFSSGNWNKYADADRSELTTNGTMEADTTWEPRGTPTTEEQSTDQANNGSKSWKIVSDSAAEGAFQDITTVVGKYYEVHGYIYVTAGDAKIGKEDTDGSDQVLTGQATAAAWNEFNVLFLATETTSRIFFQSDATSASTFYVDDAKVYRTGLVSRHKFNGNLLDVGSNNNDLTAGGSGNTYPGYSLRPKAQKMLLGVG